MAKNPFVALFGQSDPNAMMQQLAGNNFASQLLSHYGLSLPQLQQNVILPNQGFFANHPRLSTGIENALIAAANMGPSHTIGEGISNVARGLMGIQPTRDAMQMSRLMAPFAMAKQLQDMETGQANLDLMQAHANYYNGRAKWEAQDNSLPFHSVHVGSDGNLWGISKKSGRLEMVPTDQKGLFQVPGSGMGWTEELDKGMLGLLPDQQKMDPVSLKQSIDHYKSMNDAEILRAGGKAGAAWGAQHNQPGAMTPSDEAAFNTAKRDAAINSLDYLTSHALDPNPVPFEQFHKNAVDRMEQLVPGSSGERGSAPSSPMPRSKKGRTSAAAPPPAADGGDVFGRVQAAMERVAQAKAAASNPQRFAPQQTGHGASSSWEPESRVQKFFMKFFHPGAYAAKYEK